MNRAFIVGLLLLLPITASAADDLYQKRRKQPITAAVYDWTGVYVGVHFDMAQQPTTIQSYVQKSTDSNDAGAPFGSLSLKSRGYLGGAHLGYNHQFGGTVVGIEGDGSIGASKTSKNTEVSWPPQIEAKYAVNDASYVSLRGRLGFAANNLLIYGTFGGAFRTTEITRTQYATTSSQQTASDYSTAPTFIEAARKSQVGLALGGGVEYASGIGWSLYASYMVTRWEKGKVQTPKALESVFSDTSTPNGRDHQIDATTQTFRMGVNYKL